jgi:hypothetical protein
MKLNKINIKTLKYIDLRNNQLSEGINDFINNNCYNINKLIIENCDNKLIFDYSDKCQIKFEYSVKNENINNILKAISFKGIKSLFLDNFSNIEFLNNESLKDLIELNLNQNPINDITIFNQVKFINIEKIHLDELEIEKGFNSLHVFNSIKARSILLEPYGNKYFCKIEFIKPSIKTNIIFDNLNFLKDSLLTECTNINIAQSILDNNANFFSFSEIKNSFPIFKKLRANKLEINYNSFDKKYECNGYFNYNIKLKFIFNDNLFLRDNLFHDIYSIKIYNGILDDNLDLSIQKFPFLTNLELENNKIEGMKIFNDIDALQKENKEREKYNDMNYDKSFKKRIKKFNSLDDDELIIRFLSLVNNWEKVDASISNHATAYMQSMLKRREDISKGDEEKFKDVLMLLSPLGGEIFKVRSTFSASLYDAITVATAAYMDRFKANPSKLVEAVKKLKADPEFREMRGGASSKTRTRVRIGYAVELFGSVVGQ